MKTSNRKRISEMNPAKVLLVLLLSATALWANPSSRVYKKGRLDYVPSEVLVKYRKHVSPYAALNNSQQAMNTFSVHVLSNTPAADGPTHLIKSLRGKTIDQAIADFSANPDVEYAQPNYIYHATAVPNDPDYVGQLWGLKNTAQTVATATYATNNPGISGRDIDAETAWNTITDCSSVVVAVIDSGVNYAHEDLAANMVSGAYTCPGGTGTRGCDFVGAGDTDPRDLNGHGSHVAGTIGAVGNNSIGTAGVCWTAQILAVRVLDASGTGTTADIVEGVNFAVATGAGKGNAKVINLSLGGTTFDTAFNSALNTAQTNGVVVVVAAGNANANHYSTSNFPCDYAQSNIICVAAADQAYAKAAFSDYDSNAVAANRKVDIAAPGTNIRSAYFGTTTTITDTFGDPGPLNWTQSSGWAYSTCLGPASMVSPTNWCSGGVPGSFLSNEVYKNFNLLGYNGATLSFVAYVTLSQVGDDWSVYYRSTGGNPFPLGTDILTVTGPLDTAGVVDLAFDVSACNTLNCTIGYRYRTDGNSNAAGDGALIGAFTISGKTVTTNAYKVEDGTSMAAPHVAGIATMLRARNPNFTAADTVAAILNGGDATAAFAANTKTGMVADAQGSLKYIPDTVGVALSTP